MAAAIVPFLPAIVSGVGSLIGGITGSGASKRAAQQQQQSQQRVIDTTKGAVQGGQNAIQYGTGFANDILKQSADKQLGMYAPYVVAGGDSLRSIQELAGTGGPLDKEFSFNPTDLEKDPGFAFALKQGQEAIARSAGSQGKLFGGATAKSLASFSTGTAEQYFNDAFTRAKTTFDTNRTQALSRIGTLQGLAGFGLQATGAGAGAVGDTSRQIGQNLFTEGVDTADIGLRGADVIGRAISNQGNAQAAGTVGSANSWNNAISGFGQSVNDAAITKFLLGRGVLGSPNGSPLPGVIGYSMPRGAPAGVPAGAY